MKYILVIASYLLSFSTIANDNFSIYLVRHAEKQLEQKNPNLTECGEVRAEQLASMLEKVAIEKIYSTSYNRTMATAQPYATQKNITITQYSPRELSLFSAQLLKAKQNSLVVGHSNTTPQLAALLSDLDVEEISEKEYRNLYQIQVSDSGKTLTLLTQPLTCD